MCTRRVHTRRYMSPFTHRGSLGPYLVRRDLVLTIGSRRKVTNQIPPSTFGEDGLPVLFTTLEDILHTGTIFLCVPVSLRTSERRTEPYTKTLLHY